MGSLPSGDSVCVIGAGSSGLAAIRECLEAGLSVQCFERAAQVGGAWLYEPESGPCSVSFDSDGLAHATLPGEDEGRAVPKSPMYTGLLTNVPSSLMAFRQRPFRKNVSLFPDSHTVEDYLVDQAEPLRSCIRFSTVVTKLRYSRASDSVRGRRRKWLVETRRVSDLGASAEVATFDFVVLANGHYTKPWIPFVPGLSVWEKGIEHSRWFRDASPYKGKSVLVVGNSASGYDIARMIAVQLQEQEEKEPDQQRPRLYQSARSKSAIGIDISAPGAPKWAKEIHLVPEISHVDSKNVYTTDGQCLEDIDLIIFATGYLFSFPFIDQQSAPFDEHPLTKPPPLGNTKQTSQIKEGGLRIHSLDQRQLFYWPDPSLCVLAINYLTIPFPLAEAQAKVVATYWSGRAPHLDFKEGIPESEPEERKPHVYGSPKELDYQDAILAEIGLGTDGDGKWDKFSVAHRETRAACKPLRRAVLGY